MKTLNSAISILPSTMSPEVANRDLYHSHCKFSAYSTLFLNYFQVFYLADDILIGFFLTTKHFTFIGKSLSRMTPMKEASILTEPEPVPDYIPL